MIWLALASSVLILLAAVLGIRARHQREALGLSAEIVYGAEYVEAELFISETQGLVGKPDYIIQVGDDYVPVERKSRQVSQAGPHESEVLQLAAYCLLVEERFGRSISQGRLQYANRSIDIPFDQALREMLQASLRRLRDAETLADVPRNHRSQAKCRGCGFRDVCTDSLA
jgi:CRISPR-associated exonuclease Cas4